MKILLACSAGMSTSLVEKSIKEHMAKEGIKGKVEAHGSEAAKEKIKDFDLVLLGPQVRFMKASFEEIAGGKPVGIMAPADYALAKGDKIFDQAKKLLGK